MAAFQRTLLSLAVMAMLIELAMAASYTVGGSNGGWDTSTDLQTWASSQSFLVGDNLVFQYTPNHDVVEVTKADYDSCQTSNPIKTYTSGSDSIPLSSPGKRYFTCGTIGHCAQGMKIEINTLATASSPPTPSPLAPPTSAPKSSTPLPAESPESAPTTSPPSSSDSPLSSPSSSPSSDAPASPETRESSPAPSAANVNYKAGFQASLAMGFGVVMLLASNF